MSQVGDIVLRHRPELRQVYVPYVTNMMYQEALITKLMSVSTSLTFSWLRSYCCSFSVAFASLNLDVWSVSPFWGPLSCFPHLNTHSTLVYQCWIIPNNQCVFFTLFGLRQQNHRFVLVLHTLEKHPKCQRQTLKSFLVLPFQRITRIKLILQVCRSECICCICLHCTQNGFIIWCLFFSFCLSDYLEDDWPWQLSCWAFDWSHLCSPWGRAAVLCTPHIHFVMLRVDPQPGLLT